jgi:hypothetical protein
VGTHQFPRAPTLAPSATGTSEFRQHLLPIRNTVATRPPRTKLVCPRPPRASPRPLHGSVPVGNVGSAAPRRRGHTISHQRQKCVPFPFKECLRETLVFYPKHGRQSAAGSPTKCVPATATLPPRGHTTSTWRDPIGCVPSARAGVSPSDRPLRSPAAAGTHHLRTAIPPTP